MFAISGSEISSEHKTSSGPHYCSIASSVQGGSQQTEGRRSVDGQLQSFAREDADVRDQEEFAVQKSAKGNAKGM
jgi:hypothetical protein